MVSRIRGFKRPLGCTLALFLAGCATSPARKPASPGTAAETRFATRVFLGKCVMSPGEGEFAAALLGAVLPSLISGAFNRFGNALEAAGKEHTWQETASRNFETSKDPNHWKPCVQIVRGDFVKQGANEWATPITRYTPHGKRLGDAGILLAGRPDFFFEGAFRTSTDPSVMAIVPVFVDFNQPIGTRALRGDKARSISLTFAFHPPGKAATDTTNPSTNLVLGELSPGALVDFEYKCLPKVSTAAPAVTGGPPPAASPAAGPQPTTPCVEESLWFKLTRGDTLTQLSMTVAVTEVQGKNEFLMFLSDVFKGSKEGLEKLAQQTLIESEREKARLAAVQADNEAAVNYDKAATAALVALEACRADPTPAKSGDARVKQQTTNLAAAKAGVQQPFTVLVPLNGSADALKKACETALANFK